MFSIPNIKKAKEVMNNKFIILKKDNKVGTTIDLLMKSNEREVIIEGDDGKIEGIVSLTDISHASKNNKNYKEMMLCEVMAKDIIYANKEVRLDECRDIMIKNNIGILPVLENGKIIGVINQKHIRDFLYMEVENYGVKIECIIGQIKEGICALNKDGTVVLWNKFMEERYDISAEKILGDKIDNHLKDTISYGVLATKQRESGVYQVKGKEVYAVVDANPMFINSEFVGVVCTEVDVTEVKKLSQKLRNTESKLRYLEDEVKNLSNTTFKNIIGKSYKLEKAKEKVKKVANTTSSIFIFGESGTGKEGFARAIHDYSNRQGKFIPVNCSAIPSELFESEFFGYESGSFTGANKNGKKGIFELSEKGTIFLDEIADLPLSMQAKLLRVLEEKEIRRIGGEKIINVNSRIISATNKNLLELIKQDKFREDLYYRLNVVQIDLPPLRERKEDIPILVHKFIQEICKQNGKETLDISKETMKVLQMYSWKGNIRELKNTMENLVILSRGDTIEIDDIPEYILESSKKIDLGEDYTMDLNKAIVKVEVNAIKKALSITNGNKAKASKILNIPRTTLYYKMEQYKIQNVEK
ncbi:sigma-54 dependent transcriptional regulator PrdR [Romboutsia sedimentorum]|uniref:Sigma-54 dependent transcriptional regulator PrdR n=1 Tax=Romboutsia sedimentorum TaxID=1368474 RepID=A0ABT7E7A6_9FIRM|nr:sigma-54 dependent transcriptional regulator PrdR [Romboutsia sedimentorum]MDK2562814.1 sigma-54 dependent transcriptional regulator PrdR [Romboutsia sedimentorum]